VELFEDCNGWKELFLQSMKAKSKNQVTGTPGNGSYRYTVYFEPQADGGFAVVFPAFPEIVTFGRTLEEARAMARDALRCHLEGLRKDGEAIPPETPPAGNPIREEVVVAI
jgi:predicted RNase H-like HicB family nuclease